MQDYDAVLEKIGKIEGMVRKHFQFSDEQSDLLLKKKETAKTCARDHQVSKIRDYLNTSSRGR